MCIETWKEVLSPISHVPFSVSSASLGKRKPVTDNHPNTSRTFEVIARNELFFLVESVPSFENFIDSLIILYSLFRSDPLFSYPLTPSGFSLWKRVGDSVYGEIQSADLGPTRLPSKTKPQTISASLHVSLLSPPPHPNPHQASTFCHLSLWINMACLGGCTGTVPDCVTLCLASFIHCHSLWDLNRILCQRLKVVTMSESICCFYSIIVPTVLQLRGWGSQQEIRLMSDGCWSKRFASPQSTAGHRASLVHFTVDQ